MSVSKFDGVYWHMIEAQSGNRLLNYEVNVVAANNNSPSANNYDENVPFTTGSDRLEQAEALGFASIEAMKKHQEWLDEGGARNERAKNAVAEANRNGSNIVDARNII